MTMITESGKNCSCKCQEDKKRKSHYALKGIKLVLISFILLLNLTLFVKAFIVLRDNEERISALEVNFKYPKFEDIDVSNSHRTKRDTEDSHAGCSCLDGLPGSPGLQGMPGIPGPKGDKGSSGLPGAVGRPGLPGIGGLPGKDGRPGIPGLAGIPGPIGPKGDMGEVVKTSGDPGIPIPARSRPNGDRRTPGSSSRGEVGPRGPPGSKGDRGNDGKPAYKVPNTTTTPTPKSVYYDPIL